MNYTIPHGNERRRYVDSVSSTIFPISTRAILSTDSSYLELEHRRDSAEKHTSDLPPSFTIFPETFEVFLESIINMFSFHSYCYHFRYEFYERVFRAEITIFLEYRECESDTIGYCCHRHESMRIGIRTIYTATIGREECCPCDLRRELIFPSIRSEQCPCTDRVIEERSESFL